jgi:hypothetical protein
LIYCLVPHSQSPVIDISAAWPFQITVIRLDFAGTKEIDMRTRIVNLRVDLIA